MVKPATKPKLSKEEEQYRHENFPDISKVVNKNLLCTSCNSSVKQQILRGKPRSHPFLETLLCEKCFTFFGDGNFSVDEDGSDKYCRWCGQGGTLYLCSKCTGGFCKKCIKRNLPRAILKEVEEDDWECLCCNVTPLFELRTHCWAALEYVRSKTKDKNDAPSKKRAARRDSDHDSSDDENTHRSSKKSRKDESPRSRQSNDHEEDETGGEVIKKDDKEKIAKKTKQFKIARAKLSATLQDLVKLADVTKNKALDFKKKRVTAHKMNNVESITAGFQSVSSILESVEDMTRKLRAATTEYSTKFNESINEDEKEENGLKEEENGVTKQEEDEEEDEEEKTKEEESADQVKSASETVPDEEDVPETPSSPTKSPDEDEGELKNTEEPEGKFDEA